MTKLAVIRIRGLVGLKKTIKDTLEMLRLYRKNYCVILENKPETLGMIKKVKDYVTYGEVDEQTLKLLDEKKAEKTKDKEGKETTKKFFRLNPPKKGFGRKGIKASYSVGGTLGYRGEKINELIKRMV